MTENISKEILSGAATAFWDSGINSNLAYRPRFISNDASKGEKVLSSIESELKRCDSFIISVAFITQSGIAPLLQTLKELEQKKIPGKILTTDYNVFTDPKALDKLASLTNLEVRMYQEEGFDQVALLTRTKSQKADTEKVGFHTKGYIFQKNETYTIIMGSSNMTMRALTVNKEWNTKVVSSANGEFIIDVNREFNFLWNDSKHTRPYDEFIEDYRIRYDIIKKQRKMALRQIDTDPDGIPYQIISMEQYKLQPNKMQVGFIKSLQKLKEDGERKALLISATGTGKTLASAFAMREFNPQKILFLVHREQIAKQTIRSYKRVFGSSKNYGLLSGNSKNLDAEYLFSTMQMMAKPEILRSFSPTAFDAIILDECHHAGSESYQRIMQYFKPKFWLGMTASPDTNQYDIYSIFDHNIAYEIRLQQALEEDLLCPFHYFGITDLEIDGEVFDDNSGVRYFSRLISDSRVEYIIDKANYFGYSGNRVKGLIFCSRKDEAKELSAKFNMIHKDNGDLYQTAVLTGEDSQSKREELIEQLATDDPDSEQLDYIFTVDIFNEGVDVPEINQIIMLRPTESPVVFIQQLGRGLRKAEGKDYVVILDFIGNYMNNFMIPIALSGDKSYNKDAMRRYIQEGSKVIPGSSTIHFNEISKKRIYASIDAAKTNDVKLLRDSYQTLKYKLGRIPTILDFKKYGSVDITKIFDKFGSYYFFLKKYENEYNVNLSNEEAQIIEYLSKKLVSYKRPHEILLLKHLINQSERKQYYLESLMEDYGLELSQRTKESVYLNLTNKFPKTVEQGKYRSCIMIEKQESGCFKLAPSFHKLLKNPVFNEMVKELLTFGLERYEENYSNVYRDTNFQLYQKYNYEDVCRLLNWKQNMNAQNIGGYFYDADTKTLPVFINYHKTEDAIAYKDRFITEEKLIALSKHPRRVTSSDADHIYKRKEEDKDNHIYLFVRKNKDDNEAKEFYFLGEMFAEGEPEQIYMESTGDNAFEITYRLDVPVRNDIYDYLISD